MTSARVIACAMASVLACLAAMPPASAATGDGGILHIPSAASLAHCPSSCGDVNISYPFGIGAGCFRQGFEVSCNHTSQPPKLFLGNSTTQITYIDEDESVESPMFFNIILGSGTNNYSISWEAPAKGVTIPREYNTFYVLGCDFDVNLFDHVGNPIGSCMSRCRGKVLPNQGSCNNTGCCSISLQQDISGFQATIVRADGMAARSDSMHSGIMALMSSQYYEGNTTDLFSSWTNTSNIPGGFLEVAIIDQPSCQRAQMNNATYACSTNSYCTNASYEGYTCYCATTDNYRAYLSEGCPPQQEADYYNPKPQEHCRWSCGNMTVPFPFGLEEDCFANKKFRLNCTAEGDTLFSIGDAQYHVTSVSVEDGTLTVSNMLKNASSEEVIIANTGEHGILDIEGPVEDRFDFSLEYDIVIKWAVINSTCQQAMQNNSNYACRSGNSSCLHVTHGNIFMGYRCNCSSGFRGNPYISDGCRDIDECSLPNNCSGICQNFPGSYTCTSFPHDKEFDPTKRPCVTSARKRNLVLGIAIGTGCGAGSIIFAFSVILLANKWKKGMQKRIRRAYFNKNQGLLFCSN